MQPRRALTTKQKLEVLVRYSRCPKCGLKFNGLHEVDWDHIGQLEMTGDNSLENFRPLHREGCHKAKTRQDSKDRAKTKRLEKTRLASEARPPVQGIACADDEIDRTGRICAGDERGRYPETVEKRARREERRARPMGRRRK